ncbi:MAG: iron ABC transporter permease [Treponema sp.]|nr:iron ABC transporter permease [Treponema sp.]
MTYKNKSIVTVALIILPALTFLVCLGFGRYTLGVTDTIRVLFSGLTGAEVTAVENSVIFSVRLPRIILAAFVGAGLSCAGASFQGLFSNPLATPDTLGVASGSSFGACIALLFGWNLVVVQLLALLMGLVSCALTYNVGRFKGRTSIIMIVLAGMVVSALAQAFVSLVKYVADPQDVLPAITYWLMGSMSGAGYKTLVLGLPFIVCGILVIFALRWRLNILSLNEDEAQSMGMNVNIMRMLIIVASSMITASSVSMCGSVGWVGLLIPHIARMLMGSNNRTVIPISISLGAVFLMVIDTFARSASAAEIPISILTAVIGAPFFIVLLRKTGGSWA